MVPWIEKPSLYYKFKMSLRRIIKTVLYLILLAWLLYYNKSHIEYFFVYFGINFAIFLYVATFKAKKFAERLQASKIVLTLLLDRPFPYNIVEDVLMEQYGFVQNIDGVTIEDFFCLPGFMVYYTIMKLQALFPIDATYAITYHQIAEYLFQHPLANYKIFVISEAFPNRNLFPIEIFSQPYHQGFYSHIQTISPYNATHWWGRFHRIGFCQWRYLWAYGPNNLTWYLELIPLTVRQFLPIDLYINFSHGYFTSPMPNHILNKVLKRYLLQTLFKKHTAKKSKP